MQTLARLTPTTRMISSLALVISACAGDHPLTGTWRAPDGTTPLPEVVGGGDLNIDATLTMDGRASPATFDMHMELEFSGLVDTIDVQGTYVVDGSRITMTFTGFTIDPASGNTASVAPDGAQCITLQGFGGAAVCYSSPQTHDYTLGDDTLTLVIDNAIAGADVAPTTLTFTRSR